MNSIFDRLKIEIYGGSHESAVGAKVSGLNKGDTISIEKLNQFTERRKSTGGVWATPRREPDNFELVSGGTINGDNLVLDGTELNIKIENTNTRTGDYENIKACPRPSHADYVAYVRDGQIPSGGGRFSGRMTAPICVIGGICKQLLEKKGVEINAYISKVGQMNLGSYKKGDIYDKKIVTEYNLPLIDREAEPDVVQYIAQVAHQNDSIGGVIECVITGVKAADLGDNLFESIESKLAFGVSSIPAVRGVEFGAGFDITSMLGSQANDQMEYRDGEVYMLTNNSGGINGGISNGCPITFAVAVRPTPSISKAQHTVDLIKKENAILEVRGRHDACILPRAVPCVEAVSALVIYEEYIKRNK